MVDVAERIKKLNIDKSLYDSFVEKVLKYFRDNYNFYSFKNKSLKDYNSFKNIIDEFKEKYGLEEFDYKKIDQFLWLFGKDYFPKKEKINK